MATSTIPVSNPAGNNQMSPPTLAKPQSVGTVPAPVAVANPATNPFTPATPGQIIPSGGAAPSSFITQGQDHGENALLKQYTDIYGEGTGGSLFSLLNSMSGTNSAALNEFIKSLAPQQAKAEAGLGASLGAMGVGGNSSVAALGEAGLQADMFGAISGEAANLTTHQEDLTANILSGTMQDSADEVASSGWDVFGNVMNSVGNLAADFVGAGGVKGISGAVKKAF